MPLTRGADGKLGVKGAGGGNQVNVNIINNNGSQVSTESRETPQGMDIEVMIDQAVAGNISGHGKYANKALRQNFGARGRLIQR
jgi:phage-related minor tail protein